MPRGQSSGHRALAHLLATHFTAIPKQAKEPILATLLTNGQIQNKIYSIVVSALAFFGTALGQDDPRILLNEGEIRDTTIIGIDQGDFGVKIDWGQKSNDTLRYEIVHARGSEPMDLCRGKEVGIPEEFNFHDIRRVRPGNRLVFKIDLNGKKITKQFHVLSTMASETKPWFFNVYFLYRGDTLNREDYKVSILYRKDSLNTPPNLKRDTLKNLTRYYFSDHTELPHFISIEFKKHDITYEFLTTNFFHADILIKYTERKRKPKKQRWDYNSELVFVDRDITGGGSSLMSYR